MGRDRVGGCDRRRELAVLGEALTGGVAQGSLVVVRGPAGIGKTTLLDAAARQWRSAGAQVIRTQPEKGGPQGDPLGFRLVVNAVRDHFEQIGQPRLVDSVSALSRLCEPPEAALVGSRLLSLVSELGGAFDLISRSRPAVLVVDDAHLVHSPTVALGTVRRPGCLVVAAGESCGVLEQLTSMADQVIDLPALPDDRIKSMVVQVRGVPVDDAVLPALRQALGGWFGNPGTVRGTLDDLERCGRFVVVRGQLCLLHPGDPIALSDGHDLVSRVARLGATATRLATAVAVAELSVDDLPLLAEATGGQVTEDGRMIDRMIDVGVLRVDPEGLIRCACPALAASLAATAGAPSVREVHLALAEGTRRRWLRGDPVDLAVLAERVVTAGLTMGPYTELAGLLAGLATPAGIGAARAARWLHAAWWHARPDHVARSLLLERLLPALVSAGAYTRLREVTDRVAQDGHALASLSPNQQDDLAAAAMLAAIHTGEPRSATTVAAMSSTRIGGRAVRRFCSRWFAGGAAGEDVTGVAAGEDATGGAAGAPAERGSHSSTAPGAVHQPLLAHDELVRISMALDGCPIGADGDAESLAAAGSLGDLATVFTLVLGERRYGPPSDGVLAAYQRVVRGYEQGDFTAGLGAARELELSGRVDTPVHHMGRLLAAEMCTLRGEFRHASGWLAAVPVGIGCRALRGWAECGLLFRSRTEPGADRQAGGSPVDAGAAALRAFEAGWQVFTQVRAGTVHTGLDRLLPRLAWLAMSCGQRQRAEELLVEVERLRQRDRRALVRESALLTRALVHRDLAAAKASADLARLREHRPATMHACLVTAELTTEPMPWLHEAYELAKPFGSGYTRSRIGALMRRRGISAPRPRVPRERYSAVELRIVELLRYGWTNRQIAVEIRMSEKTVENYLTRLFARTGCRSRVELAAASVAGQLDAIAS